ncbi:manganese catalase family protein [Ammonifex thiophilus]|uniref:Manganese catalase family protein n=1 Tax=Ammonifex thiophilus TaxID=444093 RepID=A0A3D8P6T3_9THEO|nr:manganese catalase family protein [Ammonifex thiophilus]RDV84268.1 manganese catalase family protein [Ammonifex thiophilus]
MWIYVKHLQRPVRVSRCDVGLAKLILTQFGGPDGEFSASWRYITQAFTMPTGRTKALLIDIGTEELAHLEMVGTLFHMLIRDATPQQLRSAGLGEQYAVHGFANFLNSPGGEPWTSSYIQATGDPVADLTEDMAAEQKARAAYERLLCSTSDPDVREVLSFLREREVVHFQRFGEALQHVQSYLDNPRHLWPGFTPEQKD